MGILTPGIELHKLFIAIIADPYTIFQMEWDRSRSGRDIDGNKNDTGCRWPAIPTLVTSGPGLPSIFIIKGDADPPARLIELIG